MPSLRSYIVKRYLRLGQYLMTSQNKHKDIFFIRKALELATSRLPSTSSVTITPIKIKGMEAGYFKPQFADKDVVMLYLHGGGYAFGSYQTHSSLISRLASKLGIGAIGLNYSLWPENPYPAALNDALTAYEWLLEKGYHPEDIFLAGDSAGGGLVLATLLALRDYDLPLPALGVCLSPWTDLTGSGNSVTENNDIDYMLIGSEIKTWGKSYANNEKVQHPYVSPLYGHLEGLPPLLLQVGTAEVLLDDSLSFAKKARKAGNDIKNHQTA